MTFAVTTGTLPAGLTLTADGLLSGTPTTAGSSAFTVDATDAAGVAATQTFTVLIKSAPTISPDALPDAVLTFPYSQQLSVTGGVAPFTFAVSVGTLPGGLSLDPATGLISGTPTTAGSTDFTITATDADGVTADQAYTLIVSTPPWRSTRPPCPRPRSASPTRSS